jgi:hypothetical protein
MLDNKKNYAKAYANYYAMPVPELERELGILFKKRYEEYNIEVAEAHRIASLVYNKRTRSGTGLIFHMQEFLR